MRWFGMGRLLIELLMLQALSLDSDLDLLSFSSWEPFAIEVLPLGRS